MSGRRSNSFIIKFHSRATDELNNPIKGSNFGIVTSEVIAIYHKPRCSHPTHKELLKDRELSSFSEAPVFGALPEPAILWLLQGGKIHALHDRVDRVDRVDRAAAEEEVLSLEIDRELFSQFHSQKPLEFGILMMNLTREMAGTIESS